MRYDPPGMSQSSLTGERPERVRWTRWERVGFGLLFALWSACFALATYSSIRATPYPPVYVRVDPLVQYPIVDGSRSGPSFNALQKDDLLLSWNGISLREADDVRLTLAVGRGAPETNARVELMRAGRHLTVSVPTASLRRYWPRVAASVVFVATAGLFVLRAQANALTRTIVYFLLACAYLFCCTFETPSWLPEFGGEVQIIGGTAAAVFGTRLALLFPHGIEPKSRWLRWLPFGFVLMGPLDIERAQSHLLPRELAHQLAFTMNLAVVAVSLTFCVRNYRRATPLERRQLKWLAWAMLLVAGTLITFALLALAWPALTNYYYAASTVMVLLPLALLIGIIRFNHFDIDRLLSATATVWLLLVMSTLAIAAFASLLGHWTTLRWGLPSWVANATATCLVLLLAASAAPKIMPLLDTHLFVERAALRAGLSQLLAALQRAPNHADLVELLGTELVRLLQPECLAIYSAQTEGTWAPVFARGQVVPALLPGGSRLLELCREHSVMGFEQGRLWSARDLPSRDLAFVQALDARVALTIYDDRRTAAVAFVGAKGSGDVFVASDLALLSSVSHVGSQQWAKAARSDVNALVTRYVPHALLAAAVSGQTTHEGEQEVTVLFIDIRGYSSYAEKREPKEVFKMVSAYTLSASQLILEHGGTVVDFNGDGMMALFGAPGRVDGKEASAVRAAQALVDAMRDELPAAVLAPVRSPIGVGVATGTAFVGSVSSAGHAFWTALGAVTNRAARLQALTRELECDVVIDRTTYQRASADLMAGFVLHPHVALRGHAQRIDLYAYATTDLSAEREIA